MKTQDIKNMGHAYLSVLEAMKKKLDPVDKDELKGDHKDRKDKDIDNDGDADESDAYLHNRRKTISKASKGKEVETTESVEEAKKVITAKQIKNALSSAKAQAKPKDQVSLKKAPFDIPKESVVYEAMSNNIVDRLHNGEDTNRHMGHEGGYRQHKSAAEDARADGNTKAASSHERAAMSHEHAAKNLKAGKHEVALHHSKDAGRHAMLAVKHGGEETDSHEVHKDHSKAYTDFTGFKSESTERSWTVLNRILEKAHAKDSHTKGATEPEKMGSTASKDEMGFVNAHGGLTGTDSGIDGAKAAAYTASVATANIKVAPGRLGDNKAGDKNIIKPGTQVK
jgi:hypothetical protein